MGITQEFKPRFLRQYADLRSQMLKAVENYIDDVKSKDFPNEKESY
jgi:3-methyl-2-oxobutanoate hydroxymethyltransferase